MLRNPPDLRVDLLSNVLRHAQEQAYLHMFNVRADIIQGYRESF